MKLEKSLLLFQELKSLITLPRASIRCLLIVWEKILYLWAEFEKMFPAKQPSKVRIKLKNGIEHSAELDYPKGDPRQPMTEEDLDNKFVSLSSELLSAGRREQVKSAIWNLEDFEDIGDFMRTLAADK